ncbi:MAG: ribonuclease activity regulator RraA [Bauldia sp.]|nr:ribonuclease activity regulator RraA [Bauldia sp.]
MTDADEIRAQFLTVSTATLTTALFKRGLRNVFVAGARPLNPAACRMAGPAFTLRYIPAREDLDTIEVFKDPRHPQRHAVETIPPGAVMVVDSRGDAHAASAGGILITRMMVRGAAGFVTDGGLRDSPEIGRMPFPAFCRAPSAPTNLIRHHAIDIDVPIGCGGVAVYPGDWVVGDGEGVVIVPKKIAAETAAEAVEMTAFEDWVERQVAAGRSIIGLYPPNPETRAEYEAFRAKAKPGRGD